VVTRGKIKMFFPVDQERKIKVKVIKSYGDIAEV